MLPLTGYADRLSVRPGETIRFHVANATGAKVEAKLVRVVCADANPAGPGIIVEPVASPPAAVAAAGEERVPRGSYARIEGVGRCFGAGGFSITCLVHPTRLAGARQAIASRTGIGPDGAADAATSGIDGSRAGASHPDTSGTNGSRAGASHPDTSGSDGSRTGASHPNASGIDGSRAETSHPGASGAGGPPPGDPPIDAPAAAAVVPGYGFTLAIDEQGRLCASIGDGETMRDVAAVPSPLDERAWHAVWLVVDTGAGEVRIGWAATSPRFGQRRSPHATRAPLPAGVSPAADDDAPLLFAATNHALPACHFNGKLEDPAAFDRPLTGEEIDTFAGGGSVAGASACWDFSRGVGTSRIEDTGPHGLHGSLVNVPARGVTGSRWTGREMCWRHAPAEYAAVHFHEDDVDDCGWPVAFEWTVPEGIRSSTYALMLAAADARENVPFFVVPPKGRATAPIAVLVSTFTYTIYGNHARPEWSRDPQWTADWKAQAAEWGAYPHNPGDHVEYGLSTYNHHTDGSGISIASWRRPMLNVRIGYVTYPYPGIRGSGLRHFPADTHLTAWLEAKGYEYDVVTDQELHDEGAAVLEPYRVVTTGTHPEYHTRETLDALEAYRDGGGRLCYLGGNGFYWKVALSPEKRGVIEIRRGEGGIRAWAAEPGEYYNQFDGEYGGLWRRNGRPPQTPLRGRLHRPGQLRGVVLPQASGSGRSAGGMDVRRRRGRDLRRPRPRRPRRGGVRARPRRQAPRDPLPCGGRRQLGEPPAGRPLGARARGASHPYRHVAGRAGREADPRRPHLLRDPEEAARCSPPAPSPSAAACRATASTTTSRACSGTCSTASSIRGGSRCRTTAGTARPERSAGRRSDASPAPG